MNNRQLLEQEAEALQSLLHHPGWEYVMKRMRVKADTAMQGMRGAKTQDDLLKHTYTYLAVTELVNDPADHLKHVAQILQSTKKP